MELLIGAVLWFGGAAFLIVVINLCWAVPYTLFGMVRDNTLRRSERRR